MGRVSGPPFDSTKESDEVAHPAPGTQNPDQSASMEERLALLEQLLTRQQERIDQQDEEIDAQRAEMAHLRTAIVTTHAEPALILPAPMHDTADDGKPSRRSSRRTLLKLGGVVAAAGVAAVAATATNSGTAHAHSDTATFQQSASGFGNVAIEGDGNGFAQGVAGISDNTVAVSGQSTTSYGVFASSVSNIAMRGESSNYVGVAGFGHNTNGVGGWFVGPRAALALGAGSGPGAPLTDQHFIGDIYLDSTFTVWVCTANGTPGTWTRLTRVANGASGGATTYLPAPVRLLDARSGANSGLVNRAALAGGELYFLTVAGLGNSGIPSDAQGLICNVTVLGPDGNGNLSLFPAGHTPLSPPA